MKFTSRFNFNSNKIYNKLSVSDLSLVKERQELIKFKAGDKLFYEEGIPTGMFQLISGKVKKYKTIFNDQQQIFYIYTKDDLFGYHALLSNERYQDSCEALEDVVVNFISRDNFIDIIKSIPTLKDALLFNMAHEFGVLANIIGVLSQKSQNVRLALFLMVLQKRFSSIHPNFMGVDLTREDLANIVGTSRESLSRSINFLKKENYISVNKRLITVTNEKEIEKFIYE
jgi:CRP-like cAMP-binding protein